MLAQWGNSSSFRRNWFLGIVAFSLALTACSDNVLSQTLYPQISTGRGCGYDTARYGVGEKANFYLRVDSFNRSGSAYVRIWNWLGGNDWQLLRQGNLPLRKTFRLRGQITSDDRGLLVLQAWTSRAAALQGFTPYESRCEFAVVFFFEIGPIPQIETHKGCGSLATFAAGDLMKINIKIDGGNTHERAYIRLYQENRTGELQLITEQVVWYGATISINRKVQLKQSGKLILQAWASSEEFRNKTEPVIAECVITLSGIKSNSFSQLIRDSSQDQLENSVGADSVAVQAQLLDLRGQLVFSTVGLIDQNFRSAWKKMTASLANGVYLAIVQTRDTAGEVHTSTTKVVLKR
jgi:hypothetical protein